MHDAEKRRSCILIADDEPANLEVMFNTLSGGGDDSEIIVANNGPMVLELLAQEAPDLVLLDALMPGMNGFEVCRTIKSDVSTSDIPVIFITSLTETSYKVEAFQAGAVDFISKPFDRVELLARVRTHLALRTTTRALMERTEDLRRANERLKAELDERARAEAAKAALQEEVIRIQRERLLELSTPLIPITDRILAMPLIGTLDVERAQRIVEITLLGASQSEAIYVIIDMTGVKAADANVVSMLVRLADGLRLLGRRPLITGISSEVARTLVGLDVPLDGIVTSATLQSGIRYAMEASRGRVV